MSVIKRRLTMADAVLLIEQSIDTINIDYLVEHIRGEEKWNFSQEALSRDPIGML